MGVPLVCMLLVKVCLYLRPDRDPSAVSICHVMRGSGQREREREREREGECVCVCVREGERGVGAGR